MRARRVAAAFLFLGAPAAAQIRLETAPLPLSAPASVAAGPSLQAPALSALLPAASLPLSPAPVLAPAWESLPKVDVRAVAAFAPLAAAQADPNGRVTPALQAALARIENDHSSKFTRGARRAWQTMVANFGAVTTLPLITPPVAVPYWQIGEHPLADFRSNAALPQEADVVVVGAGLTGASAAYRLAKEARAQGLKVVVLDGGDPAAQASGRNGGNFELIPENYRGDYQGLAKERATLSRALHPDASKEELARLGERQARAILRMAAENRRILVGNVEREGIKADLTPRGWVRAAVNATEDKGLAEEVALARSLGLDMRALTPLELDAAMGVPPGTNKYGGRLSESDGNYHPFKYVNGLLQAAIAQGAELYTRTAVTALNPLAGGAHDVVTPRGTIRAKQVILASGAFTSKLVPELDAIKLYRSQVQVTQHVAEKWRGRTVTADQGDLYGHFPQGDAYRAADGTRRAPLLLGGGRDNPTRAKTTGGIMRSHAISKRLIRRRDHIFPELKGVPAAREWAGPLDYSPDQMPGIGALRPGLIVAAGFSGYGGTYTQAAGEAAAVIALTGKAPQWAPQDIFSPRRFLKRPGGAPALAPSLAALEGPLGATSAPSEEPARSANSFWSGFVYDVPSDVETFGAGSDADAGSAAPWLSVKDPRLAAALDRAVALARSTDAGRRALDAAEKALAAQGRTLPVDVKDLGRNWGEYDYLSDRLRLHRRLFEKGHEAELAGTLAHELTHVAQHAAGLPSNALELEIEAHLLDLELMAELGLEPAPRTFSSQISEALKHGPEAFIELIKAAVPGSPFLGDSSFADIQDQLEQDLESVQARKGERAAKLAGVIEADLASLRSKKGRAAYAAFSKRVLAELRRRAAAAR